tara:strand:- start:2618 stop:4231 length:1614 start_codon:yes stop_codon:yes gene_type:complete
MESVIKIESDQGFSETWNPSLFTSKPAQQKLIDFIIPGGTGTYDLGKSWINLNVEVLNAAPADAATQGVVSSDTALYNNGLCLDDQNSTGTLLLIDPASMVRNADMFSADRGMVESIRRVDTLRQVLWNMENDKAEQHDGTSTLGNFFGRRGPKNKTSSFIQVMGGNTNVAGVADPSIKASRTARDLRINISDLFGVGSALWNSDVYGDTRIHLEIEPNRLTIERMGGLEDVTKFDPTGQDKFFGEMVDYNAGGTGADLPAGGDLGSVQPLVTSILYENYQLDMPFYVGQSVNVAFDVAGTAATPVNAIISSIEYNLGTNSTNPPAGSKQVRIFTRTSLHNNATAAGIAITNILVKANLSAEATDEIRINRAEIVLTQTPSQDGPSSIDYTTYSTEEVQGNGNTQHNQQLIVEPNAQNLIMAHTTSPGTAPITEWISYRMAINNADVCGNRDVLYGTPIHRDRIQRTFNNRSQDISNFSLNCIDTQAAQQGNANQKSFGPVFETLPLTQSSKIVNFQLKSTGGAQDMIFYKELVRTI